MKILALIFLPILGLAQMEDVSLHDLTNPPENKRTISSDGALIKQNDLCLEAPESVKSDPYQYTEHLDECVSRLHRQGQHIGFGNCHRIAESMQDGPTKVEMKKTCITFYGYEDCVAKKKSALVCLKKHSSSLSLDKCRKIAGENGLKSKEAERLCNKSTEKAGSRPVDEPVGGTQGNMGGSKNSNGRGNSR